MQRCFSLASKGLGMVAPNPIVGAVIVHEGKIIADGHHYVYGGPHAEVVAIRNVLFEEMELLPHSTLYVNLEPCSHFGKTPPCTNLILEHNIPRVVISCIDTNEKVAGKGVEKLQQAGVEVTTGVLEKEGRLLNRRFFTCTEKKRPYIILKWAQTADGYIDKERTENTPHQNKISGEPALKMVHQWRTEEAAILVGKNTILNDNPLLTAREQPGRQPLRVVIDKNLEISPLFNVFNPDAKTLVFNAVKDQQMGQVSFKKIDFTDPLAEILSALYDMEIQSVMVEGGRFTLDRFIEHDLWDEVRVLTNKKLFYKGLKAPVFNVIPAAVTKAGEDMLSVYYNKLLK